MASSLLCSTSLAVTAVPSLSVCLWIQMGEKVNGSHTHTVCWWAALRNNQEAPKALTKKTVERVTWLLTNVNQKRKEGRKREVTAQVRAGSSSRHDFGLFCVTLCGFSSISSITSTKNPTSACGLKPKPLTLHGSPLAWWMVRGWDH